MRSLHGQLAFFWIILLTVCLGLAAVMLILFRTSAGAGVESAQASAELACDSVSARYAKSVADPRAESPQTDLLQVLLQLVLTEAPHIEGGVWREGAGFLAYAYRTYEGSGVKRDVPEVKQAHPTHGFGMHVQSIGDWPVHGLLGTQPGPNKNGKAW